MEGVFMLYVTRDETGKIVSLSRIKTPGTTEAKSSVDSEIMEFLNNNDDDDSLRMSLNFSDYGLIRTIEDLINLLVEKKIIYFTELPVEAQKRIRERQRLREKLSSNTVVLDEIL